MAQSDPSNELVATLEKLEQAAADCDRGILKVDEVGTIIKEVDNRLSKILQAGSVPFRIYDSQKRKNPMWMKDTVSGYASKSHFKQIETWISIVRQVLNEVTPAFIASGSQEKNQFYFAKGDAYRAKHQLWNIMKRATRALGIVDQYLDEEVLPYIESLDDKLEIKLLTAAKKPIFARLYNLLKQQRPNIEARECTSCHDRFIIIDGSETWALGASINGLGKKASMISRVLDEEERGKLLSDFGDWWSLGAQI